VKPVGDVTRLLIRWSDGDQSAADELMPVVYNELRRLALGHLRPKGHNPSLQATALVHEAYLRMVDQNVNLESRAQFYGLASKLMRNILVDEARHKNAEKRGGDMLRLSLSKADRVIGKEKIDLTALDGALNELAVSWPRHARIVEMKFFGGLTIEEAARVLGISHATVEREWNFARAWLRRSLSS
jgi:RNA polymerase sigma factor (TIGR02999 family)